MKKVKCLACNTTFMLESDLVVSDLVNCPKCKTVLEVIRLDPPEIDWPEDPITSKASRRHRDW